MDAKPFVLLLAAVVAASCGDDKIADSVSDSSAPSVVSDLAAQAIPGAATRLTWTAPGDDGPAGTATRYEIRYATQLLTGNEWDGADPLPSSLPEPRQSGLAEEHAVMDLPDGDLFLALRAADEAGNFSDWSNVAERGRLFPPQTVGDLAVQSIGVLSVQLSWTTPRPGKGRSLTTYDIRRSAKPIVEADWDAAFAVSEPPLPAGSGTVQSFRVPGLERGQQYYFAVRVVDDFGQISEVSNVTVATTRADQEALIVESTTAWPIVRSPAWSPDGKYVGFTRQSGPVAQLCLFDVAQGTIIEITRTNLGARGISWRPGGKLIASNWPDGNFRGRVAHLDPIPEAIPRLIIDLPDVSVSNYTWSPDGQEAAYLARVPGKFPPSYDIYTASPDGSSAERVLNDWPVWGGFSWAPSGLSVVFGTSDGSGLWSLDLVGGEPKQLISGPTDSSYLSPAWNADGTSLVFSSDRGGDSLDLWAMAAPGGELVQLTQGNADELDPNFSPDGSRIAFTRATSNSRWELWIYFLD